VINLYIFNQYITTYLYNNDESIKKKFLHNNFFKTSIYFENKLFILFYSVDFSKKESTNNIPNIPNISLRNEQDGSVHCENIFVGKPDQLDCVNMDKNK